MALVETHPGVSSKPLPTSGLSSAAAAPAHGSGAEGDNLPAVITDRANNVSYVRGAFLGKGGFARCYEIRNAETNEILACKIVSKATLIKHRAKEKLATEIKIHRSLKHTNIVRFHSFFEDKENVYIVLELCPNKSLMEMVKRRRTLSESEARFFMAQIIEACHYMHTNSIIHRDMKLGNLFLGDGLEIKVGDFGLATTVAYEGERKKTLCGTPNYIAPEILEGTNGHSYEVDVWSIGCVLYTMLIGRPPFETSNIKTTYRKIKSNDYRIPHTAEISEEAVALIRASLDKDPACRPTLAAMRSHPFLTCAPLLPSLPTSALHSAPPADKKTTRAPLRSINNEEQGPALKARAPEIRAVEERPTLSAAAVSSVPAPSARLPGLVDEKDTRPSLREAKESAAAREEPRDTLTATHKYLKDLLARQGRATASTPLVPLPSAECAGGLWISKWVDYSNKYGLGYQLSDGSVGVLFNDGTKMVLAPDDLHVQSIERDAHGQVSIGMTLDNFPDVMTKKITLLKYFRSYMHEHLLNGAETASSAARPATFVHVKKWLRTKHAIVFRLSNGVIQINFFDHTKLVVNVPAMFVTYIDKDRKSNTYFLEAVAATTHSGAADLNSRLSYATDVVEHLITLGRQKLAGPGKA